jgi:arginine decarboxylase
MNDNEWTIDNARYVYGVKKNDLHFLDITEDGDLCIRVDGHNITFREIISEVNDSVYHDAKDLSSFTLRIPQLITTQIKRIKKSFNAAIEESEYTGAFTAVYPVKVNQRKDVLAGVISSDSEYGFEAGTKAELLMIESLFAKEKHRRIVCNGAKDIEYLRIIKRLSDNDFNMSISVESVQEAMMILKEFQPGHVDLVLRMKPYLTVKGHWSHSTGRDSKFGLSIHDLLKVIDLFGKNGFTDSISTVMAHVGSQVMDMEGFERLGTFMTKIFLQLRERGLNNLTMIDFGGGLPIDYESTYSGDLMYNYAKSILKGIGIALGDDPPCVPDLLIESGRGITALYSLIVVHALEVRSVYPKDRDYSSQKFQDAEDSYRKLIERSKTVSDVLEVWNQVHTEFTQKYFEIDSIYDSEMLIGRIEQKAREQIKKIGYNKIIPMNHVRDLWYPEYIVIGNFSVFNSIADHVLVNQHFPIIPIQDLHKKPETTVRLVDITCDSDGEFSEFHRKPTDEIWFTEDDRPLTMLGGQMAKGIPVGNRENIKDSYFVIPLTGAYQDAIEMDHNLLGDLPDIEIGVQESGEWNIKCTKPAETIEEILEDQGYTDLDIDSQPYMDNGD